ncbi:ABC transporter ATP-binding protein [Clostridium sartagoforme]|uniref:ABC transporter ATP-binding protein n=1 Tax=Clostridium sartagoforme TaxID=84031 RepID=A0A4S2DSF9_9CLOT|nr:ABC transporter ATP-binding protein [Clostridium sartagoforme]TGY44183.1 ABC transporter ATP-binding protein [Clostridium sartagoforme]
MPREKEEIRSKKEIVFRLFSYLKDYKKESALSIILMGLITISNNLNPYLMKIAIDNNIKNNDIKGLVYIGLFLVVINLLTLLFSKIKWKVISYVTNSILVNIRMELYTHIQKLPFNFFDRRPVGKILARVMGDVNSLKNLFDQSIQSLIPEIISLISVIIFMLILNFKLAIACILLLPVLGVGMFVIEVNSRKRWAEYRSKRSILNGYTHEDISGIKVVQSYAKENDTDDKFKMLVWDHLKSFINAVKVNDFIWPIVELSWGLGTIIVFYLGYTLIRSGDLEIGTLLAFSMYIGMFWRPIMNLSNFYNTLITNLSAADRIFEILDIEPFIKDDLDKEDIGAINGEVEFKNVSFSYSEEEKDLVLKGVSFKIEKGEKIALVGETGAGKTTIVSLISRFYNPTSGEILIDNKNVLDYNLESIRSQMGIMLQDTFLFSTSIKENIRYGKLDATDEEIIDAAKAVNAHDFIMSLENGYDTMVNERGTRLSLGQRQLLSFARALLANPRILILDEATSNIDTQTEIIVQKGIEKLLSNRTSFVIAHRLSTIRDCDKIIVIDNGEITETGTHEDLLNLKGYYYELYKAQYSFLNKGA